MPALLHPWENCGQAVLCYYSCCRATFNSVIVPCCCTHAFLHALPYSSCTGLSMPIFVFLFLLTTDECYPVPYTSLPTYLSCLLTPYLMLVAIFIWVSKLAVLTNLAVGSEEGFFFLSHWLGAD